MAPLQSDLEWIWSFQGKMEPQSPTFITMATVAMETGSKYFSYLQGPMAHLHAKFCQDRAVNKRDRIMSQKKYVTDLRSYCYR